MQANDEGTTVKGGVRTGDRGSVEVLYVYDNILKKNFVRVRFRSKAPRLSHIISMGDIPADADNMEIMVARLGGALCERHCEQYSETIDPSEAAAAAVEGFRLLKRKVRGEEKRKLIIQ